MTYQFLNCSQQLASSLKDNPDTMPIGTTAGRTEALGEYHLSSGSDMVRVGLVPAILPSNLRKGSFTHQILVLLCLKYLRKHCVVGDSTGGFSGEEDDEMIVLENLNIRSIESVSVSIPRSQRFLLRPIHKNLTRREKGNKVQFIRIRGSVDRGISLHVGGDQNIVLNIEPAAAICKPKKRAKKRDTYTCSKCGASPKKGHKCPFNNAKLPAIAERYKAKAKELIVLARRFEKTAQKADLKDKARKEA